MSTPTATAPFVTFGSDDIERAHREWGCSCGPAALAACLGWKLDTVREYLGDFERRGYMNVTGMREAVRAAGFRVEPLSSLVLPTHGLARVQWGGPWMERGVHPGAAASRTHWIATKYAGNYLWVFDINGGWMVRSEWDAEVVPAIVESIKRADGTYTFTHRWEVRKS